MASCDPNDLLAAASPYQKITGSMVDAVVIYLLAVKAGLTGLTPDQLIDLAKCYDCAIPPGLQKDVEIALLCAATGGVPPCPSNPSGGGGGCSYQDMGIAWTPTNVQLGQLVGYFASSAPVPLNGIETLIIDHVSNDEGYQFGGGANTLLSASFPNLVTIGTLAGGSNFGLSISTCANLQTVSAPVLTTVYGQISIQNDPKLTSFNLSSLASIVGGGLSLGSDTILTTINLPALSSMDAGNLIDCSNDTALTTVSFPNFAPSDGQSLDFSGGALSAASVNHILARCIANPTWGNAAETLDTSGGTSAAPSGAGIANKATLIGRGATVNTN